MKKRLFGWMMAAAMLLALLPTAVLAQQTLPEDPAAAAAAAAVQELIDALPEAETITAENRAELEAALEAIDQARLALGEGAEELDYTKYAAAVAVLEALDGTPGAGQPQMLDQWSGYTQLTSAHGGTELAAGKYYLAGDVEISNTIKIGGQVTLDLNGYVLRMTGTGRVLEVNDGQSLTLRDSRPNEPHKFNATNTPWVLDETDGTKTVYGGVITGGEKEFGGGVRVGYNGSLTMENGNIVGCKATNSGGGVYIASDGISNCEASFAMKGGSIVGCYAGQNGGGVNVTDCVSFTMTAGSIADCKSGNDGGGVYAPGSFTMKGGNIVGCQTNQHGGGVCADGNFIMEAGSITGCTALAASGAVAGVYISTSFTMKGGTIECTGTALRLQGATMQANGGRVNGDVGISPNGSIDSTATSPTVFEGEVSNHGTISGGIFYGSITGSGTASGHTVITTGTGGGSSLFYTVRATAGEGGSLSESIVSLRPGESFTFEFTPNAGCTVADVLVDGQSVGPAASYTFRNLHADHTLEVRFAPAGTKNPDTGAPDVVGAAAALAVVSLLAAGAAALKKRG